MNVLILTGESGSGHNAVAKAIAEEMQIRNNNIYIMDPCSTEHKDTGEKYTDFLDGASRKKPYLTSLIYKLAGLYQKLPFHSPFYYRFGKKSGILRDYLNEHNVDLIFATHPYPAEMLGYLRNHGCAVPPVCLVPTDYRSPLFLKETGCDLFIAPTDDTAAFFKKSGAPKEKIAVGGIPVRRVFSEAVSKTEARRAIGLPETGRFIYMTGGSWGASDYLWGVDMLISYIKEHPQDNAIVACGKDKELLRHLNSLYSEWHNFSVIEKADDVAMYLKAADVFITKPGGVSSVEAAVSGVPMIHITPAVKSIEEDNLEYFEKHGMSISVAYKMDELYAAIVKTEDKSFCEKLVYNAHKYAPSNAAECICSLAESLVK